MGWVSNAIDRDATIRVLPDIAEAFGGLYQSLWTQSHLPAGILELCRLRLAQLHQCAVEMQRHDSEVPVEKRENLARWNMDSRFSDAERGCLAFTEVYAMDAQALTDEQAAAVKTHFGDAGLVLLVEALGIFDGMTRLSLLWQLPARVESRADGLTEDRVAMIEDNFRDSALGEREKLILAFTDQFLSEPGGLSEELKSELMAVFSSEELVHLSLALAHFSGFSRCAVSLGGMPADLPVMEISLPQ